MKFSDLKFLPHPNFHKGWGDDSVQALQFFPNGYGISVVRFPGSYGYTEGLFEVAILKGNQEEWELCFTTPIADDIMGHRDEQDIENIMEEVEALK